MINPSAKNIDFYVLVMNIFFLQRKNNIVLFSCIFVFSTFTYYTPSNTFFYVGLVGGNSGGKQCSNWKKKIKTNFGSLQ